MLLSRPLIVDGAFWGTVYTFENVGDALPEHAHDEPENHITIVTFGGVKLLGDPRFAGTVVHAKPGGTIINWAAGELHGIEAVTAGATIMNIRKVRP